MGNTLSFGDSATKRSYNEQITWYDRVSVTIGSRELIENDTHFVLR